MDNIASAKINTFGDLPEAGNAIQEEAIFILTSSELRSILQEAIEPLKAEADTLRGIINALDAKVSTLESTQEQDVDRICLDIAYDRQRLAKLERIEPQPMQKDRGDILRALLAANGGKMLAKDARKKMRLDEATFSRLLDAAEEHIEKRAYHLDKRQSILIIK